MTTMMMMNTMMMILRMMTILVTGTPTTFIVRQCPVDLREDAQEATEELSHALTPTLMMMAGQLSVEVSFFLTYYVCCMYCRPNNFLLQYGAKIALK